MGHSTMLAPTATGGALLRTILQTPGAATWTAPVAATILRTGYRFVALGINLFYLQKDKVGGFEEEIYWSSTENSNVTAWGKFFYDEGQESFSVKNSLYYVRAIRSF